MTLTPGMITVDSADPAPLAAWWAERTGATVHDPYEGAHLVLTGGALPLMLAFQKVDDPTPGKNKVHLDLSADDLDAEVDALLAAGAGLVERRGDETFRWVTLTDPQGNEFCVAQADDTSGALG